MKSGEFGDLGYYAVTTLGRGRKARTAHLWLPPHVVTGAMDGDVDAQHVVLLNLANYFQWAPVPELDWSRKSIVRLPD